MYGTPPATPKGMDMSSKKVAANRRAAKGYSHLTLFFAVFITSVSWPPKIPSEYPPEYPRIVFLP
jgi:hypothetical protein